MSLIAYPIIMQSQSPGYVVHVPDIPGVIAYGRTKLEATVNTQDAIKTMIADMNYFPKPSLLPEIKPQPNTFLTLVVVKIEITDLNKLN